MSRDSRLYLYDIKTAIHKIQSYSSKMTLEQLLSDALVTDAIILNLLIIGEAVNKLPSELTKTQKHIPWQEIIGLRNVIAHEYFRLDTEIIWDTVQNELSPLLALVEALIYQLEA